MTKLIAVVGLASSTLCMFAFAGVNNDPVLSASTPILEIDGIKITLADFDGKKPAGLFQARNNYYDAQKKAIDEFANDYLLERQANKEKITVAELLERHVNSTIAKDPSEEAIRVYFEGLDSNEPYEAVRDKILDAIRQRRLARAKTAYLQSLRSAAKIYILLGPPRAPISAKDLPVRGAQTAPVLLVEYADYECQYCQQIQPALDRLFAEFKGDLAIAFKDVPLPMHSNAEKAAEAAHCAGAQGKYWEYHDLLFANRQLDLPGLKAGAHALSLDVDKFDKCLASGQFAGSVKSQLEEAQGLGVPGTPAFFINGRFVSPNQQVSYEALHAIIAEELRVAKETAAARTGTLTVQNR